MSVPEKWTDISPQILRNLQTKDEFRIQIKENTPTRWKPNWIKATKGYFIVLSSALSEAKVEAQSSTGWGPRNKEAFIESLVWVLEAGESQWKIKKRSIYKKPSLKSKSYFTEEEEDLAFVLF